MPGDYLHVDADGPAVIHRSREAVQPSQFAFAIAADDRLLQAQVLTCSSCRRPLGWSVFVAMAGLPDLAAATRAELQTALGWNGAPLLEDAAAVATATFGAPAELPRICMPTAGP